MGLNALLITEAKPSMHTVEINGKEHIFYPIRVTAALRAKSVISEIATSISTFFDPNQDDYVKRTHLSEKGVEIKDEEAIQGGESCISDVGTSIVEPISPIHAKERIARRTKATANMVESLMGEENAHKIAGLVLDSLRDDSTSPEELLSHELGLPYVFALVKNMLAANVSVFSPLAKRATEKLTEKMESALSGDDRQPEPSE